MEIKMNYNVYNKSIILTVETKRPEKWLLVDRETGEVYQGNPDGYWDKMLIYRRKEEND